MSKKYIITESQLNLLIEDENLWLRRRLNKDNLQNFITNAEIDYPMLCDDFGDEFEFADKIISRAVDDFLLEDEEKLDFLSDQYDYLHDMVTDMVKKWFGENLLEVYRNTCNEE